MYKIFIRTVRGYPNPSAVTVSTRRHLASKLKVLLGDEHLPLLPALREATETHLSNHPEKANVESITMQGVGKLWPPTLVSVAFRLCGRSSWLR